MRNPQLFGAPRTGPSIEGGPTFTGASASVYTPFNIRATLAQERGQRTNLALAYITRKAKEQQRAAARAYAQPASPFPQSSPAPGPSGVGGGATIGPGFSGRRTLI